MQLLDAGAVVPLLDAVEDLKIFESPLTKKPIASFFDAMGLMVVLCGYSCLLAKYSQSACHHLLPVSSRNISPVQRSRELKIPLTGFRRSTMSEHERSRETTLVLVGGVLALVVLGATISVQVTRNGMTLSAGRDVSSSTQVAEISEPARLGAWQVTGARNEAEYARAEQLLLRARDLVSEALGPFETEVNVHLTSAVHRSGQRLHPGQYWSGVVHYDKVPMVIELDYRCLANDADLRFYLAHVRLREREVDVSSEIARIGIAHFLRNAEGIDATSRTMAITLSDSKPVKDFSHERIAKDPAYRDFARGYAWASVYYLRFERQLTFDEILALAPKEFPEVAELTQYLSRRSK